MAASLFKNSSSSDKSAPHSRVFSNLWKELGAALQRQHQNRKNNQTYALLLQNDDYLLRDIGVSRREIMQLRGKDGTYDAGRELEKKRATFGRF